MSDDPRRQRPPSGAPEDPAPSRTTGITDGNLADAMELSEFMERLGMVMNLPRRNEGAPASARSTPPRGSKPDGGGRRPAVLLVSLLLVVAAGYFVLRPPAHADPLPEAAVGHWTTSDPKFANRGFDLTPTTVVFRTGPGPADFTRHAVIGTTVRAQPGRRLVTLSYALDGGTMTFAFRIEDGQEPTIRLVNLQEVTWSKVRPEQNQ